MNTRRQLVVALLLAGAIVAIGWHESTLPETEPMLVTQARLRQSQGRDPGSALVEHVRRAGKQLTRDEQYGEGTEESEQGDSESPSGGLPLLQILGLLTGGEIRLPGSAEPGKAVPDGQYQDWKFLESADSLLQTPRIQQLLQNVLGKGFGGEAKGG